MVVVLTRRTTYSENMVLSALCLYAGVVSSLLSFGGLVGATVDASSTFLHDPQAGEDLYPSPPGHGHGSLIAQEESHAQNRAGVPYRRHGHGQPGSSKFRKKSSRERKRSSATDDYHYLRVTPPPAELPHLLPGSRPDDFGQAHPGPKSSGLDPGSYVFPYRRAAEQQVHVDGEAHPGLLLSQLNSPI